ncbi:MAG: 3'-5' exonuclease [Fusobacteriaceae bacterium]
MNFIRNKIPAYKTLYTGNPIAIINSIYHRKKWQKSEDPEEDLNDYLEVVYKNMDTGHKFVESYCEPEMRFFTSKSSNTFPKEYIGVNEADEHICKFTEREVSIAKTLGESYVKAVFDAYKTRNAQYAMQVHQHNDIFASDMSMDEFIRIEQGTHIDIDQLDYSKLSKAYFDIEIDLINPNHRLDVKDIINNPLGPVNMITTIFEKEGKCITQILDTGDNDSFNYFMENQFEEFKEEMMSGHLAEFGITDFIVRPYTNEVDMISQFFNIVNHFKPDIMAAWNISFDIKYLLNRLKFLGLDWEEVLDIVCHKDFKKKSFYYHLDERADTLENRSDWFRGSSYTYWTCQMLTWIHTRKGRIPDVPSFGLDSIGEHEIGVGKYDYGAYGTIFTIAHNNFKVALMYNIIDVVLLKRIENKTNDLSALFIGAQTTCTPMKDGFKKTVFLKNAITKEYLLDGLISENNRNKVYTENIMIQDNSVDEVIPERKDKFEGAVVGDPTLNMHRGIPLSEVHDLFNEIVYSINNHSNSHMIIRNDTNNDCRYGKTILENTLTNKIKLDEFIKASTTGLSKWIFRNIVDFDLSSLYPSIIYAFNISKMAQIAKIYIPEKVSDYENLYNGERYNRGGDFVDDYECGDALYIGKKWFGLPGVDDLLKILDGNGRTNGSNLNI